MTDEAILHLTEEQLTFFADRERAIGYREGHRAALAQRAWVGLTHYELQDFHTQWVLEGKFEKLIDAVEAKLKEKNT